MNVELSNQGWTIFTKNDCLYCKKVKILVPEARFIESDTFLAENRDVFLATLDTWTGKEYRKFPMVFLEKRFIGGYTETKTYVDDMNTFDMVDF